MPVPSRHPAEEDLIAHASGQLDLAWRVLLEGHLAYCDACSEAWSSFAGVGGELLRGMLEEIPPPHLLDGLLARIESGKYDPDPFAELPLRREILALLPRPNHPLVWGSPDGRPDTPGRVTRLSSDRRAEIELFLLEIPGGERIPRHLHLGHEHVLCLAGACSDELTHLEAGDYYHYDPGTEHFPLIGPEEPCWIAVRAEKGVRFTA